MKSNFVFCLLILSICSVFGQDTYVHDPVVIKSGEMYYLYCTGKGIACFSSKDMVTWKKEAPVFPEKPVWADEVVPDFKNHIWAPDITFHKGVYYLYYSISAFAKNTSAIGLVTNTTLNPEDPGFKWVDQGIVVRSYPNRDLWNAIDPNLVFDDSGTPWLAFGSFWDGLKLVKLNESLKSVAAPEEWYTIARRERSFELEDTDPGDAALEAPFIFKKNGYYYQFLSWDLCCRGENSTYKVVVGRSKNVQGPYLDKDGKRLNQGGGTLIIQGNKKWYGAGHCSVYTFENKDYIFFHAYDASENGAPKLKVSELKWDAADWPELKSNVL
ncbi:arabinan endo-1,5-alpha-L-arabinosidase [Robertkochia solimangrovi]|uniref:arabinan endo-1,5-alpha-L-arabinosidase n=1 Tax=Robertkochia solimangrovi TaxID=2213046 RepID=UPI00117E132F|nr:arabinan endo-1,5-alpha-L-arabinosidase [Robertkochia solimangrovi]TRZ45908.1 arabinan endo-1,5-alpha-L-arabinosidase [Robertkochia solimangrovi]